MNEWMNTEINLSQSRYTCQVFSFLANLHTYPKGLLLNWGRCISTVFSISLIRRFSSPKPLRTSSLSHVEYTDLETWSRYKYIFIITCAQKNDNIEHITLSRCFGPSYHSTSVSTISGEEVYREMHRQTAIY